MTTPHCANHTLELAHFSENGLGCIAAKAEIDRDDVKIAQRAQIGGDCRGIAGTEAAVAVIRLFRDRLAELREAVGERHVLGVAAGIARHFAQAIDTALKALQRVEPLARVGADRVPGVAELGGTPHRRTAFAADPDRHPLRHRARLEKDIREIRVFAGETGILVGPQLPAHGDRLIGDRAALVERLGADRFETRPRRGQRSTFCARCCRRTKTSGCG